MILWIIWPNQLRVAERDSDIMLSAELLLEYNSVAKKYTVNPERIASVIFNDFINPATLTSLYDNDFSKLCTCFTCACA